MGLQHIDAIVIDGRSGSGKTSLADRLAARIQSIGRGVHVLRVEDLYPGWDGLDQVADILEPMLRDVAAGRVGRYRRYDWVAGHLAEWVEVAPAPVLVLDGVGSGSQRWADLTTLLVWIEASPETRLRRGLDRDGGHLAAEWAEWIRTEGIFFARENTRARATLHSRIH